MASVRKPRCGSVEPHDEHVNPTANFAPPWQECAGCGQRESDVLKLLELMRTERIAADMAGERDDRTLYCHPTVRHALLSQIEPGYGEFSQAVSAACGEWGFHALFGVPFILIVGADRDSWRLMAHAGLEVVGEGVLST